MRESAVGKRSLVLMDISPVIVRKDVSAQRPPSRGEVPHKTNKESCAFLLLISYCTLEVRCSM